ncbi:MAG: DUF2283 domain-containing protein [Sulfuricella sp.]|nr:DUF2283 domain-containing protein [Sulfuricella sp.]
MRIEFDPIADALCLELAEGYVEKTEEIKPGVILDYDLDGSVVGIEVLYIRKRANQAVKGAA